MRFAALDGWRGLCALFVALFHLNAVSHLYPTALLRHSFLFVDFFFVLSGFVISHAYGARLRSAPELRSFVIRRFARLWPLHICMLAFLIVDQAAKAGFGRLTGLSLGEPAFSLVTPFVVDAIWTNVLLIQSLGLHDKLTWNHPSWSISTEFYTYLLFAAAAMLCQGRLTTLAAFLAACGATVMLVFSKHSMNATYDLGFFRCVYGFFIGVIVYRLWSSRAGVPPPQASAMEATALLVVGIFVARLGATPWSFAAPLVFGSAIWVFAHEAGAVSQVLRLRWPQALGRWSYSIYMVHVGLVLLINQITKLLEAVARTRLYGAADAEHNLLIVGGGPYHMDAVTLLYLAALVAAAALTYRFIEVPGQKYFNRFAEADVGKPPFR